LIILNNSLNKNFMKIYKINKSVIDKKGRGLYATRDIKEGTKIIDYIGKLITKKQTEESDKYDNGKPIYLFTINKRYDLDGDFPWNTAGLIIIHVIIIVIMMAKDLRFGLKPSRILKKVRNLLVIMDLVMMKITNNFRANVNQKIVVVTL